ncbi:DUF3833 family protein [Marinobacterium aestuariivivens]|uniref:DUF3833 family protein n=1 Tax=Marinobacterium aestuariivivens TaxID=1698799 RepID=A0ABW1ZUJ2_9GAMM
MWLKISRRFARPRLWCLAMLGAIAAFALAPLLTPATAAAFVPICLITGAALGADLTLPHVIQAEISDWDRYRFGRERNGILFACWNMATKLALALSAGFAFVVLGASGFEDGQPEPLWLLAMIYALLPCVCKGWLYCCSGISRYSLHSTGQYACDWTAANGALPTMRLLILLTTLFLAGCSDMRIEQFRDSPHVLKLEDYFDGRVLAWGSFEDRFGTVRRQFFVEIDGHWNGEALVLHEAFRYDDGEEQVRVWTIRPDGQGGYTGTADDVVGVARGRIAGNALHWQYEMNLAVGERRWRVRFDDWMLLQPDGVMLNRAQVSKWGLRIGEVRLFFLKPDAARERLQL